MVTNKLAIFNGKPIFERPRSTSNLIKPDKEAFLNYIKKDYLTGNLTNDDSIVIEMEERLAKIHGAKYCVSVCNGLWGLVLTINELKLKGKNEIIMPSLTYRRMADIAAWLQMIPHFCDVDIKTLGINPQSAESCINENTALILAPHPIVNLCDIDGMIKLAKKHNLPILFDSVEASYATLNGKHIGSYGDAECFSMHASKFLNGFEGGYITTNNLELANKLKAARNFGLNENDELITLGIGGKMIKPHVAMTLACLDGIDVQIENNKTKFYKYKELLIEINGIELLEYSDSERRSFKNIVVKLNEKWPFSREETLIILQKENMVVRPYYFPPLHLKPSTYPVILGKLDNTEILMQNHLLLPCGEFVSENDIVIIVSYLKFLELNSNEIKLELKKLNNN